ncbi:hypothetical protein C7382_10276 [Porphyromonas loveana]|uniref:Uncharacterized protein n=1 Tax=Porphyromonas loveana TaxID=1884669 RepID=A0A2U1FPJ7_9PORP|nr:hypothetical protein C7382_10276 [Porphyromonas loveana]
MYANVKTPFFASAYVYVNLKTPFFASAYVYVNTKTKCFASSHKYDSIEKRGCHSSNLTKNDLSSTLFLSSQVVRIL